MSRRCFVKDPHDFGRRGDGHRHTGQHGAGVVVDEVDDLDRVVVYEMPVRHIALPTLIRQIRLEAHPTRTGALLGLRGVQTTAHQHPVDGGERRHRGTGLGHVPQGGLGPRVEAVVVQSFAPGHDFVLEGRCGEVGGHLGAPPLRAPAPRLHPLDTRRRGGAPTTWSARSSSPQHASSVLQRARR